MPQDRAGRYARKAIIAASLVNSSLDSLSIRVAGAAFFAANSCAERVVPKLRESIKLELLKTCADMIRESISFGSASAEGEV